MRSATARGTKARDDREEAEAKAHAEPQVRGERVVQKILEATVEEMARVGFMGLSIEAVAERAGVAKTTVYRRWPTRGDLAVAAMHQVADDIIQVKDTGSIRGDLKELLTSFRDFTATARGQSLIRMMLSEAVNDEISAFVRRVRMEKAQEPQELVVRAVARGELPRETDAALLLDVAFGAVQHYTCFMHDPVTDAQIDRIIEVVLTGALHGGAVASPDPTAPTRAKTERPGASRSRRTRSR